MTSKRLRFKTKQFQPHVTFCMTDPRSTVVSATCVQESARVIFQLPSAVRRRSIGTKLFDLADSLVRHWRVHTHARTFPLTQHHQRKYTAVSARSNDASRERRGSKVNIVRTATCVRKRRREELEKCRRTAE